MGSPYFEVLFLCVVAAVVVAVAAPFVGSLGLSAPSMIGVLFATVVGAYLLLLLALNSVNIRDWVREKISHRRFGNGDGEND